ncbi:MAG: VacJ family lipoprotein [Pseudomonadota bacterium]
MTVLFALPIYADEQHVVAEDSLESFNRTIFDFNLFADKHVIRPVAQAYHELPGAVRYGIGNELTNLSEPLNALHGALQLNSKIFFTSFWRFVLNTTYGLGGLRDFAGENGLHNTEQNLGKTLGRWGIGSGTYIVLPILGPSSLRDTLGKGGDYFLDPVSYAFTFPENAGISVMDGIATRDRQTKIIDQFYYKSLDPYTATRSAYIQNTQFEVAKHEVFAADSKSSSYPEAYIATKEAFRQHLNIENRR